MYGFPGPGPPYAGPVSGKKLRFGFEITAGPNSGLAFGGCMVKVHRDDTYITVGSVGGVWKTSLHGDDHWRHGMTKEHVESGRFPPLGEGVDRAAWKFQATPFVEGVRVAYVVVVGRDALLQERRDPGEATIVVEDRWDQDTMAIVWMTEPGADQRLEEYPALVGGPLRLANGRGVWVTRAVHPATPAVPEPPPPAVAVFPLLPEKHKVTAPGLLVLGARRDPSGSWNTGSPANPLRIKLQPSLRGDGSSDDTKAHDAPDGAAPSPRHVAGAHDPPLARSGRGWRASDQAAVPPAGGPPTAV